MSTAHIERMVLLEWRERVCELRHQQQQWGIELVTLKRRWQPIADNKQRQEKLVVQTYRWIDTQTTR